MNLIKRISPVAVALGLIGCADTSATDSPITLSFAALANGQPAACGQTYTLGSEDAEAEIADLRFYVHDVRLLTAAGEEVAVALDDDGLWQNGDVALLDFEDKNGACTTGTAEMRTIVEGTVPDGDYTGIAFKLGVPEDQNHQDAATATSPLNLTSMFWNWTGGYKFFRFDLSVGDGGWLVHVGSTGCSGDTATGISCTNGNRPEVRVTGITPGQDAIALDLDTLVADLPLDDTNTGCHTKAAEADCATVIPRFGIALDGGAAPTQTIFGAAP